MTPLSVYWWATVFALAGLVRCLWIRRATWRLRWQAAATLSIALQAVAILLFSPWGANTVGRFLHTVTGRWNVESAIGHGCCVLAVAAIACHVSSRLGPTPQLTAVLKRRIELPVTLVLPALFVAFSLSNRTSEPRAQLFGPPPDGWLAVYAVLLYLTLLYLFSYTCRALLVVRADRRSRRVADAYLFASLCGIAACTIGFSTTWAAAWTAGERSNLVWLLTCLSASGFALAAAHSWRTRTSTTAGSLR